MSENAPVTAVAKKVSKKKASKKPASKKASKKTASKASKATKKKAPARKKAARRKASSGQKPPESNEPPAQYAAGRYQTTLSEDQIRVVPGFNPRTDEPELDGLKKSVKSDGLLQPLLVRPSDDGKSFDLVGGHQRLKVVRELGGKIAGAIPVVVREDLKGDLQGATAAAIAESNDGTRTNLNPIDIGKKLKELEGEGWTLTRIANRTGLNAKRVRRCLDLVAAPKQVQEMVRDGKVAAQTALEVAQLPEEVRKDVYGKVGPGTTAKDIRKLRREFERAAKEEGDGTATPRRKDRTGREAPMTRTWKSPKEKSAKIAEYAYYLREEAESTDGEDFHFYRGLLAAALYDRGDIDTPYVPSIHTDDAAEAKFNELFDTVMNAEAKKFTPPEEDEGDEESEQ